MGSSFPDRLLSICLVLHRSAHGRIVSSPWNVNVPFLTCTHDFRLLLHAQCTYIQNVPVEGEIACMVYFSYLDLHFTCMSGQTGAQYGMENAAKCCRSSLPDSWDNMAFSGIFLWWDKHSTYCFFFNKWHYFLWGSFIKNSWFTASFSLRCQLNWPQKAKVLKYYYAGKGVNMVLEKLYTCQIISGFSVCTCSLKKGFSVVLKTSFDVLKQ